VYRIVVYPEAQDQISHSRSRPHHYADVARVLGSRRGRAPHNDDKPDEHCALALRFGEAGNLVYLVLETSKRSTRDGGNARPQVRSQSSSTLCAARRSRSLSADPCPDAPSQAGAAPPLNLSVLVQTLRDSHSLAPDAPPQLRDSV